MTSARSYPGQVAIAFAPLSFITTPAGAFTDTDAWPSRRRNDAINQLRRGGSPLAAIARERTFKTGQKRSTFPWANTATALYNEIGRRWLVTQIAVLGAASPHHLAYTKKPDRTAFGPDGHPAELLAQTRDNAANSPWWTRQLDDTSDELGRAEWALAFWSVAHGPVLDALFDRWKDTVASLEERQRKTLLRSCNIIASTSWLTHRLMSIDHAGTEYQVLIAQRSGTPAEPSPQLALGTMTTKAHHPIPSLLSEARREKWLKVDSQPSYR